MTVTLADDVDVGRGDVLAARDAPPPVADQFEATIVWMDAHPLLQGRTYLMKLGATDGVGDRCPDQTQGQRQHAGARRGEEAGVERYRRVRPRAEPAGGVRGVPRQPGARRLHPRRSADQRHRGRRPPAFRAAAIAERPVADARRRQVGAGRVERSAAVRHLVDRPLGVRQVDDCQPRREALARARTAHVSAGRRQRAPRPEQGSRVHRSGPRREHPPRSPKCRG